MQPVIKNKRRTLIRWIKGIVLVYILLGFALYYFQEKLLLHPVALPYGYSYSFSQPFKEINIPINQEENLNMIQFYPPDKGRRGVVLYFHGNMTNINHYAAASSNFTKHGYEVWMVDYPGFGKTTGTLTEKKLYAEAKLAYQLANTHYSKDSIVIYGRSFGTGIASWLAANAGCRRLILETPYSSIPGLFSCYAPIYPSRLMAKLDLPVIDYLAWVKAPVTIFHGDEDEVIPLRCASRLKKVLKPGDEFILVPGGQHNNLGDFSLFRQKMDSLLQH